VFKKFVILFILFLNLFSINVYASTEHSLDQVNEEEVHDLISGQELKNYTVEEIAKIYEISANEYAKALSSYYGISVKNSNAFQLLHDNYGVEPSVAKEIASSVKTGKEIEIQEKSNSTEKVYHLVPISVFLLFLYAIM